MVTASPDEFCPDRRTPNKFSTRTTCLLSRSGANFSLSPRRNVTLASPPDIEVAERWRGRQHSLFLQPTRAIDAKCPKQS